MNYNLTKMNHIIIVSKTLFNVLVSQDDDCCVVTTKSSLNILNFGAKLMNRNELYQRLSLSPYNTDVIIYKNIKNNEIMSRNSLGCNLLLKTLYHLINPIIITDEENYYDDLYDNTYYIYKIVKNRPGYSIVETINGVTASRSDINDYDHTINDVIGCVRDKIKLLAGSQC